MKRLLNLTVLIWLLLAASTGMLGAKQELALDIKEADKIHEDILAVVQSQNHEWKVANPKTNELVSKSNTACSFDPSNPWTLVPFFIDAVGAYGMATTFAALTLFMAVVTWFYWLRHKFKKIEVSRADLEFHPVRKLKDQDTREETIVNGVKSFNLELLKLFYRTYRRAYEDEFADLINHRKLEEWGSSQLQQEFISRLEKIFRRANVKFRGRIVSKLAHSNQPTRELVELKRNLVSKFTQSDRDALLGDVRSACGNPKSQDNLFKTWMALENIYNHVDTIYRKWKTIHDLLEDKDREFCAAHDFESMKALAEQAMQNAPEGNPLLSLPQQGGSTGQDAAQQLLCEPSLDYETDT